MASDIQPGDLVVCVDARPHPLFGRHTSLVEGRAYRVTAVGGSGWSDAFPGARAPGIKVAGAQSCSPNGYLSSLRFRKLNDEPDNIELVRQIKACKPISEPAIASSTGRRG